MFEQVKCSKRYFANAQWHTHAHTNCMYKEIEFYRGDRDRSQRQAWWGMRHNSFFFFLDFLIFTCIKASGRKMFKYNWCYIQSDPSLDVNFQLDWTGHFSLLNLGVTYKAILKMFSLFLGAQHCTPHPTPPFTHTAYVPSDCQKPAANEPPPQPLPQCKQADT